MLPEMVNLLEINLLFLYKEFDVFWYFSVKTTRLRQAKEEAEMEVANYRSHLEAEYKQKLSEV